MENLKDLEVFKKISLKEFKNYVNKYISEDLEVGNRYDYGGRNSIHYTIMKNIKKGITELYNKYGVVIEDDFIIDTGGRCEWEPSEAEEKRLRKLGKLNVRNYKEPELAQLMTLKGDK